MLYVGLLVIAIAALGFMVALHLWFWSRYYAHDDSAVDEVHWLTTDDGWRLALTRYRGDTPRGQPLLLCHGLGANHFIFDVAPRVSLARYLKKRGWDVWLLDLRGVGTSEQPTPFNQRQWSWNVEDYLEHDIPAAIEYVCQRTHSPALHWIGHSMGALLMYPYLQGPGAKRIRSFTAIAAPAFFEVGHPLLGLLSLSHLLRWRRSIPTRTFARLLAPMALSMRLRLTFLHVGNVEGPVLRRFLSLALANLSTRVVRTMSRWVQEAKWDMDQHDVQSGLATIRTPTLLIAGEADPVAPPSDARRVLEHMQDNATLHILGRRHGQVDDYGHTDLLIGRDAATECFPLIGEWLEERAADFLPTPMPDGHAAPTLQTMDEGDERLLPPSPPTLEGPYGLLNRFSPTRRQRWHRERKRFRRAEEARYQAYLTRQKRLLRRGATLTTPPPQATAAPHRETAAAPNAAPPDAAPHTPEPKA